MEEIWKPIPGYEGLYEVSNLGRVKRLGREYVDSRGGKRAIETKIMSQFESKTRGGYLYVSLIKDRKKSCMRVHRLVARAFLGEPPTEDHQVDHIDGDRTNNRIDNLEYVTRRENYARMARNQGELAMFDKIRDLERRVVQLEKLLEEKDG